MPKGVYSRSHLLISPVERFWRKIRIADDGRSCWEWAGATFVSGGYGAINVHGVPERTHRFAFELAFGPIPRGYCVCHKCDNPLCVRPSHLFLGTIEDNNHDCDEKGRRPSGEGHCCARLTKGAVRDIRVNYKRRIVTQAHFATKYGVDRKTVADVINGKTWKGIS